MVAFGGIRLYYSAVNKKLASDSDMAADRGADSMLWRILPAGSAMLALLVFAFSASIIPSILMRAAPDLGVRPEVLATVITIQFIGFFAASVGGGIAADRFGKKLILRSACILMAIGALLWARAHRLEVIFLGSFVMGMAGGVLESVSSALLSDLFPRRRKMFLNLSQIAYCLAAASGPFIIGKLLPEGVSWRVFFSALAVMPCVLFVFYSLSRIPHLHDRERISLSEMKQIIRRRSFLNPCAIMFLYVFSEATCAIYINYYMDTYHHTSQQWAISSLGVFWISMMAGRILCAFIPEEFSYRNIITILMAASGAAMVSQVFIHTWQMSVVFFAAAGFFQAGTWPLIIGMTTTHNRGYSGTVVGITVACGALAIIAVPLVMRPLFGLLPAPTVFAVAALPLFAGAVLARCQPEGSD